MIFQPDLDQTYAEHTRQRLLFENVFRDSLGDNFGLRRRHAAIICALSSIVTTWWYEDACNAKVVLMLAIDGVKGRENGGNCKVGEEVSHGKGDKSKFGRISDEAVEKEGGHPAV